MAGLPVLAIGTDRAWRARLERILALRGELTWRGAHDAAALHGATSSSAALWLLDGDDPAVERLCTHLHAPEPVRLYFYRHPDVVALRRCAQLGGSGCLDKQASPEVLLRAIRAVDTGLFAVDTQLLLRALASERRRVPTGPPGDWSQLTERQREIVHWAAQGMSNKQIARRLGISPETVKTHLHHVFEREGISGRVALLATHRTEAQNDARTDAETDDVVA